ncbi:membrane fusion protein, multidrug efflux system [Leeuwenhoekiella marinoflava DSM 3653]|uniref:Membrane fusion protein (Multidrug efflux system) n=4 Tax=Leeuwenhoekiella marinoflava TaxID=988 RepID=A0A4Q0PR21_9FLAO|nr:membrane fusion protein (multidrug efflux system) [Leeuwenhoekiella marinoflava]SHE37751.1 membrane fusion protein, multidrug efflux system [Leeuwenhoekiella marinoflava DSM 3653]
MMKKRIFIYIVPVFMGVFITTTSCGDDKAAQGAGQAQQAQQLPVITIPQKTVTGYSSFPAKIEGIVNSGVRAKIQGYISNVLVDEGEKVRKGQRLFKLETQSLTQDANAAKASVNAAQVEVDKLKPLVEKGIISNVQLETAKAQLEQANSNYESIAANIDYGSVKSPVDGFVGAIPFREGALVGPTDTTPLTTVSDIEKVYAFFSMNESDYLSFLQNTAGNSLQEKVDNFPPVLLQLANGETYDQEGKIETVTGQIDTQTGTVSFRAVFENPNQLLTNGNSGVVRIPVTYEDAVIVPQNATLEQQGQILVYQLDSENKASSTVITIKDEVENYYVVKDGLKKGDKIIANGIGKLRNGTPVNPKETSFDSLKPVQKVFK